MFFYININKISMTNYFNLDDGKIFTKDHFYTERIVPCDGEEVFEVSEQGYDFPRSGLEFKMEYLMRDGHIYILKHKIFRHGILIRE